MFINRFHDKNKNTSSSSNNHNHQKPLKYNSSSSSKFNSNNNNNKKNNNNNNTNTNNNKNINTLIESILTSSNTISTKKINFIKSSTNHIENTSISTTLDSNIKLKSGSIISIYKNDNNQLKSGFIQPNRSLYALETIKNWLGWKKIIPVGIGLNNLGNTCFLNASLQSLLYAPPFVNYLLSNEHSKSCKTMNTNAFCLLCAFEKLLIDVHSKKGSVSPQNIVKNLRSVCSRFRLGRQEDSHEYIRYMLDNMQKNVLSSYSNITDWKVKETCVINRIFGGYLVSYITCDICKHDSCTYDANLDLSLEISSSKINSVNKALQDFTKTEVLDGDNKYKCEKCKIKVRAYKQMKIEIAPMVLTIQFKRFGFSGGYGYGGGGQKINKHISFETKLNIREYLKNKSDIFYNLFAVLVHAGSSTSSGHYYCYVKSPSGQWYACDDSSVYSVSLDKVLSSNAYILFYVQDKNMYKNSEEVSNVVEKKNEIAIGKSTSSESSLGKGNLSSDSELSEVLNEDDLDSEFGSDYSDDSEDSDFSGSDDSGDSDFNGSDNLNNESESENEGSILTPKIEVYVYNLLYYSCFVRHVNIGFRNTLNLPAFQKSVNLSPYAIEMESKRRYQEALTRIPDNVIRDNLKKLDYDLLRRILICEISTFKSYKSHPDGRIYLLKTCLKRVYGIESYKLRTGLKINGQVEKNQLENDKNENTPHSIIEIPVRRKSSIQVPAVEIPPFTKSIESNIETLLPQSTMDSVVQIPVRQKPTRTEVFNPLKFIRDNKKIDFANNVDNWDSENWTDKSVRKQLSRNNPALNPSLGKRKKDEWDTALDEGRVKKVKRKQIIDFSQKNSFQNYKKPATNFGFQKNFNSNRRPY